jgi:hypothetical protein
MITCKLTRSRLVSRLELNFFSCCLRLPIRPVV